MIWKKLFFVGFVADDRTKDQAEVIDTQLSAQWPLDIK